MVFSFLNKIAISVSVDRLAQKAASPEAFDTGVSTPIDTKEAIERYYNKYGSTERKFEYHPKPGFYIGYVKVADKPEFLSVIFTDKNGSTLSSWLPDIKYGQDIMSLMAKRDFAKQIADGFIQNAGRVGL